MVESNGEFKDLNILISSCDEYADLWSPFFNLFFRFWPDCPFYVFLSSVKKPYYSNSVQQILVNERIGWGDGLIKAIQIIQRRSPRQFLLLMLDDYLITEPVETKRIIEGYRILKELNGNYLRLIPKPSPDKPLEEYPLIGSIKKNSPYRSSLQASIWRTDTLLSLLRPIESPWDMEVFGSQRSRMYDGFFCTYKPLIKYINGIERGKWVEEAYTFLTNQGFAKDIKEREIQVNKENKESNSYIRRLYSTFFPLRFRLFIKAKYSKLRNKNID